MTFADTTPLEIVQLGQALGLIKSDGELDTGWFGNPADRLSTVLTSDEQRTATLTVARSLLGTVTDEIDLSSVQPDSFIPIVQTTLDGGGIEVAVYLVVDDTVAGRLDLSIAGRISGTPSPNLSASTTFSLPLARLDTDTGSVDLLEGDAELGVTLAFPRGISPGGQPPVDLDGVTISGRVPIDRPQDASLAVVLRGLRFGGSTTGTDLSLDVLSDTLGADAIEIGLALLQAQLDDLLPEIRHLLAVIGLNPAVDAVPGLPLGDLLAGDTEALRQWLLDLLTDSTAVGAWLDELRQLLGLDSGDLTGTGTTADPLSLCFADTGWTGCLTLSVVPDAATGSVTVVPGVVATIASTGSTAAGQVDARITLARFVLGPEPTAQALPELEVRARLGGDTGTLVDQTVTVGPTTVELEVGAVAVGIGRRDGRIVPAFEAERVTIGTDEYDIVDLTSAETLANVVLDALDQVVDGILGALDIGATDQGRALAALAGLIEPAGAPAGWPDLVGLTELFADPAGAIACYHVRVLGSAPANWSLLAAEIGVLLQAAGTGAPTVTGIGTEDNPWLLTLFDNTGTADPVTGEVTLAAWSTPASSPTADSPATGPLIHLALRARPDIPPIDGLDLSLTYEARLLDVVLPPAASCPAPVTAELMRCHTLTAALAGPIVVTADGLELRAASVTGSVRWCGGDDLEAAASVVDPQVLVEGQPIALPNIDLDFGLDLPEIDFGAIDWDAIRLLFGSWFSGGGSFGDWLPRLGSLLGWLPSLGDITIRFPQLPGLDLNLPSIDWPSLDLEGLALGDFGGAFLDWLGNLFGGGGGDFPDLSFGLIGWLSSLFGRLGDFDLPDGPGPLELRVEGSGTYDDPWCLPIIDDGPALLLWLDPDGPSWSGVAGLAAHLLPDDLIDAATGGGAGLGVDRLTDLLQQAAGLVPDLRRALSGVDLPAALAAIREAALDGDGLVRAAAQAPDGWDTATLEPAVHLVEPSAFDPAVHLPSAAAPPRRRVFVATDLPDLPGLNGEVGAGWPGETEAKQIDLTDAGLAPEAFDLTSHTGNGPWFVLLPSRAAAAVTQPEDNPAGPELSGIEGLTGRLRRALDHIRTQVDGDLAVIAHSTAGQIARLITADGQAPVSELVTIGTPHLPAELGFLDELDPGEGIRLLQRLRQSIGSDNLPSQAGALVDLLDTIGSAIDETSVEDHFPIDDFSQPPDFGDLAAGVRPLAVVARTVPADLDQALAALIRAVIERAVDLLPGGGDDGDGITHVGLGLKLQLAVGEETPGQVRADIDLRADLAHIELQPGTARPVPRVVVHTELRRNGGWLARGPGLAPPIDLPRDPRVRWAEIDLDLTLDPFDAAVRVLLHDASVFGVDYETWVIDDSAVIDAIDEGADALADGVSSLVSEARVLLGEVIAQLGPVPTVGSLRRLADLAVATLLAEIDADGLLILPPDPIERFLVDPVAEIQARLAPGSAQRTAAIDGLREMLGGGVTGDEIVVSVGSGLELVIQVGTEPVGTAIEAAPHRVTLRTTGDGFVVGEAIEIEGEASLDQTGAFEIHAELGAAMVVGAVGRTTIVIEVPPLTVRLVADGGAVPALAVPIDLHPLPDTAAMADAVKRFILARMVEHALRVAARAEHAVGQLASVLLDPLGGDDEFAYRYVSRLVRDPKAWLLDHALLGRPTTGGLPALDIDRVRAVVDAARSLLDQPAGPPNQPLDLPWGLTVAVGPGPDADRVTLAVSWNPPPPGGIVSASADLGLHIGPGFEVTPAFTGTATLSPLPSAAFSSAAVELGVDADGTVAASFALTPDGDSPIVVELLPTPTGLDTLAGRLTDEAVQQILPIVLDAAAADPTVGPAVAAVADLLALRTGPTDPRFDVAALADLADATASDLVSRINAAVGANAAAFVDAVRDLVALVVDQADITVEPAGPRPAVSIAPFTAGGTSIEVELALPATGPELCVEAVDVEPVADRLRLDAKLCVSPTGVAGLSLSGEVIDARWLQASSVSFLPQVAVRLGSEANPGPDRIEAGLWLTVLPVPPGQRRGVFLLAPLDGSDAEVVCRTEESATPRTYQDSADLEPCLVDALLVWLVPLAAELVIDIDDVVDVLRTDLDGRTLGRRLADAGVLAETGSGPSATYDLEPGLFDVDQVGDRLLSLGANLLDGVTIPGLDGFDVGIETEANNGRTRFGLRVAATDDVQLFSGDGFRLSLRNDASWLDGLADGLTLFFLEADTSGLANPAVIPPIVEIGGVGLRVDEPQGGVLIDLLATVDGVDLSLGLRTDLGTGATDRAAVRLRLEELTIPIGAAGSDANPVAAKILSSSSEDNTDGDSEELAPALSPEITVDFAPDVALTFGLADESLPIWIPIQRSFGPIYVEQVGAALLDPDSPDVKGQLLLDGGVSIEGFSVTVDDLSLAIPLKDPGNLSKWEVGLAGLGIGYDQNGIEIAGAFRFIDGQYAGMLKVQVAEYGITAVGAYGEFPERPGQPTPTYTSMFIFGVLSAPLGGIPPFFVTAIGAGVGLNRRLAIPAEVVDVVDFSLVSAMDSQSDFARDPMDALDDIIGDFPVERGTFWLAAGVRFTSFALVESVAVLTVEIGDHLEVNVLGLSRAVLPRPSLPLASIEMALRARFSTEEMVLSVQAQLTDNSFILTPSARLTGGFAFVLFFRTGDFVFTLGGYHPRFDRPAEFPDVPRLGFEWSVSSVLSIKGGTYFALTSSCVMAGGSLEASYDAGFAWASLTIGADALLSWDPFFYDVGVYVRVSAGVKIRICFFACATVRLSFSIGVDVFVTGPELSGRAELDLDVVSVTIRFGASSAPKPPTLDWPDFELKYLKQNNPNDVSVGLSIVSGLQPAEPATTSTDTPPDDGSAAHPWRVLPEFELVTNTRAASNRMEFTGTAGPVDVETLTGQAIDIRPMGRDNISSVHRVVMTPTGSPPDRDVDTAKLELTRITQPVPTGTWEYVPLGSEVAEARTFDAMVGWRVVVSPDFQQTVENEIEIDQVEVGDPHPLPFHDEIADRPDFVEIAEAAAEFALDQPTTSFEVTTLARTNLDELSAFGQRVFSAELAAPPRIAALGQGMVDAVKDPPEVEPIPPTPPGPPGPVPGRPRLEGLLRCSPAGERLGAFQTSLPTRARGDLARGQLASVEMPTLAGVEAELEGETPARLALTGAGLTGDRRTVRPVDEGPKTTATSTARTVIRGRRADFATAAALRALDGALENGAPLTAGDVQVWRVPGSRFDAPAPTETEAGPGRPAGRARQGAGPERPRWAVAGDQLTRTIVLGRAGTVLADQTGLSYELPLPVGTDRVVSVGVGGGTGGSEATKGVAGWQMSTEVARVGPGIHLGPRTVIRTPDERRQGRRLRGGGALGLGPAGLAVANAQWVETRLPADTTAVAVLLELPAGPDCTDRLLDELVMSLVGATRTDEPPIVTAVGQRLIAVYAVEPEGDDAVVATVARGEAWQLAGVMGGATSADELAGDLLVHDPSTLSGSLVAATAGRSTARLELPDKPGPGVPYGDDPTADDNPWRPHEPRPVPGRRRLRIPARPPRRPRSSSWETAEKREDS